MSGLIDLDTVAGARSTHKFARLSASKARVVLDLIRDDDLEQAREELQFCDRGAATVISKVLESAVSNAENNENLSADELYVAECWADEGPTLKRWRPRARGRATRINKRTCHITVVVAQLSEEELEMRAASLAASGRRSADQDRAARVAEARTLKKKLKPSQMSTLKKTVTRLTVPSKLKWLAKKLSLPTQNLKTLTKQKLIRLNWNQQKTPNRATKMRRRPDHGSES